MATHGTGPRCPSCGAQPGAPRWLDCFCPDCGRFCRNVFTEDHPDPKRARRMTMAQIRREFAEAGVPFRAATADERRVLSRPASVRAA